jgi:hypothetical protein
VHIHHSRHGQKQIGCCHDQHFVRYVRRLPRSLMSHDGAAGGLTTNQPPPVSPPDPQPHDAESFHALHIGSALPWEANRFSRVARERRGGNLHQREAPPRLFCASDRRGVSASGG